jgi:heme/copper-type cytochrome/quinol oxidase subunit 4
VFHFLALYWPQISIPEPESEHLFFVVLNLFFVWLFLEPRLPVKVLILLISLLLFQQIVVHVPRFIQAVHEHRLDLQSPGAIFGLVFVLAVLIKEME